MQILPSTSLPWPVSATAPHCAATVHRGMTTGPGPCHHPATHFMLIRYPTSPADIWPVFLCTGCAREVPLAEPLDQVAAAELADRHEQHALAVTGQPYRRPVALRLHGAGAGSTPLVAHRRERPSRLPTHLASGRRPSRYVDSLRSSQRY